MQIVEIVSAVADYRRCGYTVLAKAVPTNVLDSAEEVLDERERSWERHLRQLPDGRSWISHAGEITFTARLAGSEPVLRSVLASNVVEPFMAAIVGPRARLYFDQAVYKKPGCLQMVPWHQDNGYNPKLPADYVTFWIPLTDTNLDNGTI